MDPSDKMWCGIFSEGELKEIKSHNAPDVTALPVELDEFISTFNDKVCYIYEESNGLADYNIRRLTSS